MEICVGFGPRSGQSSRQSGRLVTHADAWIAATAIACGAPLLTHNAADYKGIAGLSVITEVGEQGP